MIAIEIGDVRGRFYVSVSLKSYAQIADAARARGISPRRLVEIAIAAVGMAK